MNETRSHDRTPKPQAVQKHPHEWQGELNPGHLEGQSIGLQAAQEMTARTAFTSARRARISARPRIHARGDMAAGPDDADMPKDRVPYEIWNRPIGEEPGQR